SSPRRTGDSSRPTAPPVVGPGSASPSRLASIDALRRGRSCWSYKPSVGALQPSRPRRALTRRTGANLECVPLPRLVGEFAVRAGSRSPPASALGDHRRRARLRPGPLASVLGCHHSLAVARDLEAGVFGWRPQEARVVISRYAATTQDRWSSPPCSPTIAARAVATIVWSRAARAMLAISALKARISRRVKGRVTEVPVVTGQPPPRRARPGAEHGRSRRARARPQEPWATLGPNLVRPSGSKTRPDQRKETTCDAVDVDRSGHDQRLEADDRHRRVDRSRR